MRKVVRGRSITVTKVTRSSSSSGRVGRSGRRDDGEVTAAIPGVSAYAAQYAIYFQIGGIEKFTTRLIARRESSGKIKRSVLSERGDFILLYVAAMHRHTTRDLRSDRGEFIHARARAPLYVTILLLTAVDPIAFLRDGSREETGKRGIEFPRAVASCSVLSNVKLGRVFDRRKRRSSYKSSRVTRAVWTASIRRRILRCNM